MQLQSPRQSPYHGPDWHADEVFRAIPERKLALIGAITLEWNYIKDMVDDLVARPGTHRASRSGTGGDPGRLALSAARPEPGVQAKNTARRICVRTAVRD